MNQDCKDCFTELQSLFEGLQVRGDDWDLNRTIQSLLLAFLYHTSALNQKHIQIALKQLYLVGSEGKKTLHGHSRDIEALSFKGKLCLVSPYSSWCKIIPVVPIGVLHLSWWCKESMVVLPDHSRLAMGDRF